MEVSRGKLEKIGKKYLILVVTSTQRIKSLYLNQNKGYFIKRLFSYHTSASEQSSAWKE